MRPPPQRCRRANHTPAQSAAQIMPSIDVILPTQQDRLACKCCGGDAPFFRSVDFDKSTEPLVNPSGVLVHYYRCARCSFIFTDAFDRFTHDDFLRLIYNDRYMTIDPDYVDKRPRDTAGSVAATFPRARDKAVLDYGGGNGRTAEYLRAAGFAHVDVYDPFVPGRAQLPKRTYDLVICVEVAEHVPDPHPLFADLAALIADRGLVCLTTLLQPPDPDLFSRWWWYAAPRNGHASLYSSQAMGICANRAGLRGGSLSSLVHVLFRTRLPDFAAHIKL